MSSSTPHDERRYLTLGWIATTESKRRSVPACASSDHASGGYSTAMDACPTAHSSSANDCRYGSAAA